MLLSPIRFRFGSTPMPVQADREKPPQQRFTTGANDEFVRVKAARKAAFQARVHHVEAHEAAHYAAAGRFAAGGPVIVKDEASGQVSGHVPIRMEFGTTAAEARANAAQIQAAALAPGDPSGADLAVAAAASTTGARLASERSQQEQRMREAKSPQGFQPQGFLHRPNPFSNAYRA